MKRQNRSYKRGEPFRDARIIVIICEGAKREPQYFNFFKRFTQRIKIEILESEDNKSAPNHFLSRADKYVKDIGITDDDSLWFVSDRDRWELDILRDIALTCDEKDNWFIAISNPCFEVWLLMHLHDIKLVNCKSPKEFKQKLDKIVKGGYRVELFAPHIESAITQAKACDTNPDHFMPNLGETKLYKLGEQILDFMGRDLNNIKKG